MDSDRTRKDNGKAEFKFDDINYLSEMIEKMGSFIGTAANDFSEIASNVSDILEEIGINITEDEESKINQLVIQLSKEDRKEILSMIKNKADSEQLTEWWSQKCDNKKLVDILVKCSDTFSEVFNTGNDTFGKFLGNSDSIFDGIASELEKVFCSSKSTDLSDLSEPLKSPESPGVSETPEPTENFEPFDLSEPSDRRYAEVCSNLGNCISEMLQTFNEDEDADTIRTKTIHVFSDLGVDEKYMYKCFDLGYEMGEKLNSEVTHKSSRNVSPGNVSPRNESPSHRSPQNRSPIRYGIIEEAARMIEQSNKLSADCTILIGLLSPVETEILQEKISIPLESRINSIETKISQLDQKLERILNKLESHSNHNNRFTAIEEKIDDIALDLELIRNKTIKRIITKR